MIHGIAYDPCLILDMTMSIMIEKVKRYLFVYGMILHGEVPIDFHLFS
jgi:hypothetical protein